MSHLNFASPAPRNFTPGRALVAATTIAATILAASACSAGPGDAPASPTSAAAPEQPPTPPRSQPPDLPDANTRTASEPLGETKLSEGELGTLARGKDLPIDDALRLVVSNREAWVELWGRLFPETNPAKPMPAVDFATEVVLVASSGRKPTAGYAVTIRGSDVKDGRMVVAVEVRVPKPDAVTARQSTNAYHIVRHARFDGTVVFEDHAPPPRKEGR